MTLAVDRAVKPQHKQTKQTPKTGFLITRLMYYCTVSFYIQRKSLNQSAADSPNGSMGESSNDKMVTMETKLPRKQSVVWVAMKSVKTKLSLTEEGASPVNWKVIFLVFVSLVSEGPFLKHALVTQGDA